MIETSLAPPPVAVFEGSGTAPMPLLWAQRELWDIIQDLVPRDYVTNAGRVVEAPRRRIGIGAAATAIGHLLSRHEILRIRVVGDDDPRQEVLTRGCCEITLVETTAELARAEARPLMERLRTVRFASDRELPARFGLIVVDGLVHYVTFAASHVSADGHVLDQLARDLRMLLLGRSLPPRSGLGLADLVARQQSAGSRHTRKALAHWRDGLLRVPQTTFAARPESAEPRYRYPVLTSAAMLGAARRLAAVHRTTTSIVLLAATVGAIAELTGHGTCGLLIHVSNRFRSECATVVAPAAQMGLVVVEVGGRPEWSELLDRTARAATRTYRHTYHDPVAMSALEREVVGLGGSPSRALPLFNDVRPTGMDESCGSPPTPEAIRAAAASTTFRIMETPGMCAFHFYLEAHYVPGAIEMMLIGDAHHLAASAIDNVLQGCERRLLDAIGA